MDSLRERKVLKPKQPYSAIKVKNVVKQLDLFPKVNEDYVIQTQQGGYVTLITICILVILFISEFYTFALPRRSDTITVSDSGDEPMYINLNLTLYNIPCGKVIFDIFDEDGVHPYESSSHLVKLDIDNKGNPIGFSRTTAVSRSSCGSCYGAGIEGQCCSSCDEIISVYEERGWNPSFVQQFSPLCNKKPNRTRVPHIGCMVWGALQVHQVAGSIHISAKSGRFDSNGTQLYDNEILSLYNSSHIIHHFTFGDPIPGITNPLQNKQTFIQNLSSHHYHINVLPAIYQNQQQTVRSNEIAVYEDDYIVNVNENGYVDHEPGLFFYYTISPYMHVIHMTRESFSSFIVRVCAVIGGAFAVSRTVDHLLYYFKI